jgi:hypothetical protein
MTIDQKEKALKPPGLQGLLVSVCNRLRPLTPGVPNNNHDFDDADASRLRKNRVKGYLGHGCKRGMYCF